MCTQAERFKAGRRNQRFTCVLDKESKAVSIGKENTPKIQIHCTPFARISRGNALTTLHYTTYSHHNHHDHPPSEKPDAENDVLGKRLSLAAAISNRTPPRSPRLAMTLSSLRIDLHLKPFPVLFFLRTFKAFLTIFFVNTLASALLQHDPYADSN